MSKKELEEKQKEVLDFYKAAFCVDGDVKIVHSKNFKIDGVIELNDSERGKFYVGRLTPKNQ